MHRVFLGEFEQLLLLAVDSLGDQAYGVGIRRHLEECAERTVSPGAIYTAMDRLQARGYVSSRLGDPSPMRGGKRKRFYQLEPEGRLALRRSQERLMRATHGFALQSERK
jgi:PadR family transcriptional regulator PadR